MASAHLAVQTSLNREVVLKILDTSMTDSAVAIERFLNEGRIVASLHHPHIITTYDIGTAGDNVYISMEFVDGGDLKQQLAERVFSPDEAISLIRKIASGLDAAHAKGIVHRDVKPGNILFRGDGTPLLSDFGIAKRLTGDADLTATGMFVGSPNYMAPEQSDIGPIDRRADIYSLGIIFFEMLTGRKAYYSDSVIDVILMHKKDPVPLLPEGLADYQELLNLMMAKDRNSRFRDVTSLLYFLDRLEQQCKLRARTASKQTVDFDVTAEDHAAPMPQVKRVALSANQSRKSPWVLAGAAIFCAIAYGALIYAEYRMTHEPVPHVGSTIVELSTLERTELANAPNLVPLDADQAEKIVGALRWLATHSLNEYRLTAPPQDNAYYYYSRLLQMNPNDKIAQDGIREIANRYAILAERDVADGNYERARSYVILGLQFDPANKGLRVLREFAAPRNKGILESVLNFFR